MSLPRGIRPSTPTPLGPPEPCSSCGGQLEEGERSGAQPIHPPGGWYLIVLHEIYNVRILTPATIKQEKARNTSKHCNICNIVCRFWHPQLDQARLGLLNVFGHLDDFFPWDTPWKILGMRMLGMDVHYFREFLDGANLEFCPARTWTGYLFHGWRLLCQTNSRRFRSVAPLFRQPKAASRFPRGILLESGAYSKAPRSLRGVLLFYRYSTSIINVAVYLPHRGAGGAFHRSLSSSSILNVSSHVRQCTRVLPFCFVRSIECGPPLPHFGQNAAAIIVTSPINMYPPGLRCRCHYREKSVIDQVPVSLVGEAGVEPATSSV